jgi:pimeloyl-ACP methyl ester carboxylesterase
MIRLLDAISPRLAARRAERLMFTPSRTEVREEERNILARAEPFSFSVEGQPIAGYAWGDGPPVLLIHGWGGHAGQWAAFAEPLVLAGFRAVALDMPGHGASAGWRSSLGQFTKAIGAAGQSCGPLCGLIAHSLGAAGATYAISRGLGLKRAVYLAPLGRFEEIWAIFRNGLDVPERAWRRAVERSEGWLKTRFDDFEPVALARRMTIPLLVLHDPEDLTAPFEEGALLAGCWPDAAFFSVEGAGHPNMLKNRRCIEQTVDFLKAGCVDKWAMENRR